MVRLQGDQIDREYSSDGGTAADRMPACVCRRIALIGAELLAVVVVGDGVVRRVLVPGRVVEVPRNGERAAVIRRYGVRALFVILRSKARISQSKVLPTPLLVAAKRSEFLRNSRR